MHHMYFNGGIFGWLMSVIHLLFPVLVIVLLFNLFSGRRRYTYFEGHRRGPLDILKERYAGGEISREEFMRMRNEINS